MGRKGGEGRGEEGGRGREGWKGGREGGKGENIAPDKESIILYFLNFEVTTTLLYPKNCFGMDFTHNI